MSRKLNYLFCLSKIIFAFPPLILFLLNYGQTIETKELQKIGEIGPVISENFSFWSISDIDCDKEGNIYIADSGWNRIFKFDPYNKFLLSFGREGQGPGEFLAQPHAYRLKLTIGKNNLIYIVDRGNRRISVFNNKGEWLKSTPLPNYLIGKPAINSKGYFYFINSKPIEKQVITCLNDNFNYLENFFPAEWHFKFPFYKPNDKTFSEFIGEDDLIILMTKSDELIVISNYSFEVYVYNQNNRLKNKFSIINDYFKADLVPNIKKAVSLGGFVVPFRAYLDEHNYLYLIYPNKTKKRREIYVYDLKGNLLKLFTIPEEKGRTRFCKSMQGKFYINLNEERIVIYK